MVSKKNQKNAITSGLGFQNCIAASHHWTRCLKCSAAPGASFIRSKDTMRTEHQLGNHQEPGRVCGWRTRSYSYLD